MSLSDLAPDYVRSIAPYQPGKPISELARELGLQESSIVKLASNENPLGVSPKAKIAMRAALEDVALYPDGNGFALKDAIKRKLGVGHDRIVLGNGSNDVLELAARAFLAPSLEAVYSQHAFAVYPLVTQAIGATGICTPARDFGHDLAAMRAAVAPKTRLLFIANPNNPTGTLLDKTELHAFLGDLPRDVLVVLDEAYDEYLADDLKSDSIAWLQEFDNLIVTRTLSKAYGLAGLRVGFALAHPQVADMMNRVRQPFNVNSVAQAAALAALADDDFVRRSRDLNDAGMAQVTSGFAHLGLNYIPSFGNFVSVCVGDAAAIYRRLLGKGVIVRPVAGYEMPQYLRVSIGLESENARLLRALEESLALGS
ncbi:MAG TPA: histidinol-phosphate transaminase [Methylophilaceae bacterium]|nr:histidinol-phosphate transaminase [Methylophilaceae bacterium]HQR60875.1 histidinol-phosphate transaminase [Methylophilaceae bacterium]